MASQVPQLLPKLPRALPARYGIAILGVILATLIRMWLHPLLREQFPFPTFFVVVILTARYVGLGPALLALLLGGVSGTYFFVPSPKSPDAAGRSYLLGPGLYLLVGFVSAVLSESLRRSRDTAERAERAMKEQAQQLQDANAEMEAAHKALQSQHEELQRLNEQLQDERQRLAFLAEASKTLASSLDYPSTLANLARLAVPYLADWCAVDIVEEDGALQRLAVAHVDPAKVAMAEELQRRYPGDPNSAHGVRQVLRTGCSDFCAEIPDSLLVSEAQDAEHLQLIRDLGLKSYLCVPLRARGQTMGVISFVSIEARRPFGESDVVFAEDLAHRAAIAVDNARLYRGVQEADRQKDRFLAILGHELRNPLATIANALHILDQEAVDPSVMRHRDRMARQVKLLTRLTDDLMDAARISQGRVLLKPERLDLIQLVRDAIEDCRDVLGEADLRLSPDVPDEVIRVDGDPARLSQVVANLLRNAAKFTDPGGHIEVGLGLDGEWATIRVRDTGVGIAAEMLPHVFDAFAQEEESRDRSRGGLGLGLALVKGLVTLHGGEVSAASEGPGQGSEFTVRLPAVAEGLAAR